MVVHHSRASGVGLERLCSESSGDWIHTSDPENGVEFLEAWFHGVAYQKHRHDTYAISLTTSGIQAFDYRGASEKSMPGQVTVLHPDETHDGNAGTEAGFGYRIVYVEPALIFEAAQILCGRPCTLPFVRTPVVTNRAFAGIITSAFESTHEPLAIDDFVVQLTQELLQADPSCRQAAVPRRVDRTALQQARQFLDAEKTRVTRSGELEAVTGLSRYELARQFRSVYGTSPYRYLLMRRLDVAREQIAQQYSLADVALETGFADQAHLTRMFKATYGLTPAHYRMLRAR